MSAGRLTPYQRRLVAAVEAEPGRSAEHYARVLSSTVWDVERTGYLLWEREVLAGDDEAVEGDLYLWPGGAS